MLTGQQIKINMVRFYYIQSNTLHIGCNNEKKAITRGMYKIRFIKQANKITEDNIPLLQILE